MHSGYGYRNDYYTRNLISRESIDNPKNGQKTLKSRFWNWQPSQDCTWVQVLKDSSIHGMKYIAQPNRHVLERLFWGITLLISLGASLYLGYGILEKYFQSPVIISFQPAQTSIAQIPYPAVTICNVNKIRKSSTMEAFRIVKENVSMDGDNGTKSALFLLRELEHLCASKKSLSVKLGYGLNETTVNLEGRGFNLPNHSKNNSSKHGITAREVRTEYNQRKLLEATQTCEQMILLCMWEGEIKNCSEMFTPILTDLGLCCSFNMMPRRILLKMKKDDLRMSLHERIMTEDDLKPWMKFNLDENIFDNDETSHPDDHPKHQSKAGEGSGLSFMVNPDLEDYFCGAHDGFGFRVLTHSPIDYPHVAEYGMAVTPGSEVFMSVHAEVTITDKDIQNMNQVKRLCSYTYESPLSTFKYYTAYNCMDECIGNITLKECSCIMFDLPQTFQPNNTFCEGEKFMCAEKVKDEIAKKGLQEVCPFCQPSCNEINYVTQVSSLGLKNDERMWMKNGVKADWAGKNVSIIHIFYGSDNVYARVRKNLYSANDLFAHVGGVLGLFLGLSVISIVEPIYFLIRSWFNWDSNETVDEAETPVVSEIGFRGESQAQDFISNYYNNENTGNAFLRKGGIGGQFPFLN